MVRRFIAFFHGRRRSQRRYSALTVRCFPSIPEAQFPELGLSACTRASFHLDITVSEQSVLLIKPTPARTVRWTKTPAYRPSWEDGSKSKGQVVKSIDWSLISSRVSRRHRELNTSEGSRGT